MSRTLPLAALALLALAACKAPEAEQPAAAPATTPPAPAAVQPAPPAPEADRLGKAEWDFSSAPAADTLLEVVPDPVDFCSGSQQAVTVRWEVPRSIHSPQIWVQAGTSPKLFTAPRSPNGQEPTGPWVGESTTFFLVDATTGKVLRQASPTPAPCG